MSCLKPGDPLKIPSKSFDLISEKIKQEIQIRAETLNSSNLLQSTNNIVLEGFADYSNGTQESIKEVEHEDRVLSKFFVTERYEPVQFSKIKEAVNRELVTHEVNKEIYKRHYLDELNRWQKRVRNFKDYEQSIEKVTTHPKGIMSKGKEELEYRRLINLKQKVVSNIPEPSEKKMRYLRSEIKKSEISDIYSTDIWTFKELQKFIHLFFENYKNFEEIQTKLPGKSVQELIALYDLLKPALCLKKFYKKAKQKPSHIRKEYIRSILPMIKEKLVFLLRDLIFEHSSTQLIIPLSETKFSRKNLIDCLIYNKSNQA